MEMNGQDKLKQKVVLRPARLNIQRTLKSILKKPSTHTTQKAEKKVTFDLPPFNQKAIDFYAKYLYFGPPGGEVYAYEQLPVETQHAIEEECGIWQERPHTPEGNDVKEKSANGTMNKENEQEEKATSTKKRKFDF